MNPAAAGSLSPLEAMSESPALPSAAPTSDAPADRCDWATPWGWVPPKAGRMLCEGLQQASARLADAGVPVPALEGKLLRPLFALALVPEARWAELDERFWSGALAIQMVHEASLLHDDVIDCAYERRGMPTVFAREGAGPAVVVGDHFLTGAYRAAVATASFDFVGRFAEAVERTVAGEIAQGRDVGRKVSPTEYDAAITGKSGELFGVAGALGGTVLRTGDVEPRYALGRAFGNLYQRIDDLLDYCDLADTGKPPLQDYRAGRWSWVLDLAGLEGFGPSDEEVIAALFGAPRGGPSAARHALALLRDRRHALSAEADRLGAGAEMLDGLLESCLAAAENGVTAQEAKRPCARHVIMPDTPPRSASPTLAAQGTTRPSQRAIRPEEAFVRDRATALGGPREWREYFGEHARTFHLAARLFPPLEAGLVSGLYAYCRFTDDLVDDPHGEPSTEVLEERLAAWRSLSLAAFEGEETGIPLLDTVMRDAADRGVSRTYPEALLDGVAMDVRPRQYGSWSELELYTFGVAGAVGGWMSQLFGIFDPDLLERAHALGHGMQLTNIARDVGEDWVRGRVYLPRQLLSDGGVSPDDLGAMADGSMPISEPYRSVVRTLLARADAYYELAWPGIRELPPFFRHPVAAAASAYRGIHREIRRNEYDNLTRRAHTSLTRKVLLVGAGVVNAYGES